MNLSGVGSLSAIPETRPWFRVAPLAFLPSAIATNHTRVTSTRFYDPFTALPQFRTIYLSEDALVAQFEAQMLLGTPFRPGGWVTKPGAKYVTLHVSVQLTSVVDLTDPASQSTLDTTVQELAGDWQGYRLGAPSIPTSVPDPSGVAAPTRARSCHPAKLVVRGGRIARGLGASADVQEPRGIPGQPAAGKLRGIRMDGRGRHDPPSRKQSQSQRLRPAVERRRLADPCD
jgi:hypothetical protein